MSDQDPAALTQDDALTPIADTAPEDVPVEEPVADVPVVDAPADAVAVPPVSGVASAMLVLRRGGADTDITFPFTAPAVIGRFDPTVGPIDIDLGALQPEGSYISRRHAKITFEDGVFVLEDLGSSNGTYIKLDDFEKVDRTDLADGSEFALGNARFKLQLA